MTLTSTSSNDTTLTTSIYGSNFAQGSLPKYTIPATEMPANVTAKFIRDHLAEDGVPTKNLASFVTTYMEPEIEQIMMENSNKNFIDYEEYPATAELQARCVNMIARLFNAPYKAEESAMGVSTVGSSEAIILAVLAMKKLWQNKRKAEGKDCSNPQIIMGANVQVCWEKAARYLDVEEVYVYCDKDNYVLDPKKAVDLVNENTIGICAILGSTYTGHYEDVKTLNTLLLKKNKELGLNVMIHVDAASGGFVAPFVNPKLEWDFRLPLVASINTSGHKYGMVYAGVGWAIWRSPEFLPKELIFNINYLGANQASFTLNFSKSASQVIGQYYVLIRLGFSGFKNIMSNLTAHADYLAAELKKKGFKILSEGGVKSLPLVAFCLSEPQHYDEFSIASRLRERGWIIPAYTMAPHANDMKLLRVVIREDFTHERCNNLIRDIAATVDLLQNLSKSTIDQLAASSKHSRPHRNEPKTHEKHSLQAKHGKTHAIC